MDIKVKIPTEQSEINVGQFMQYNRLMKLNDVDDIARIIGVVSIFCDITTDQAMEIPFNELKKIANQCIEVLNKETDVKDLMFNNFAFIPNLDNITAGVYIDLDKYAGDVDNYHRFMAVAFRPITKKVFNDYQIEKYESSEKYALEMLKASLDMLLGAMFFFCNLSKELLKATRDYFQQPTAEIEQLEKVLVQSGVGINQFTALLEETISTFQKQLNLTYTSF
jgi:hypothetical protein